MVKKDKNISKWPWFKPTRSCKYSSKLFIYSIPLPWPPCNPQNKKLAFLWLPILRGSTFAASVKGQIKAYPAQINHARFLNSLLDKGNCIALFTYLVLECIIWIPHMIQWSFAKSLGLWLFFRKHRNGTRSVHLYIYIYVVCACHTFLHHMSCRCQISFKHNLRTYAWYMSKLSAILIHLL